MSVMEKVRFGKHRKMETFSITFIVLFLLLVAVLVGCFVINMNKEHVDLDTRALYSTKFESSRTQTSGAVEHVYISEDKTQAFVLLSFDDMSKVSANAENYQAFMTAADIEQNKQNLVGSPQGSIYVFGNTGYMGVYLVNNSGFDSQILDLTIRCNKELTANQITEEDMSDFADKSYAEFDQFEIYFNPGAEEAEHLACLDGGKAPSVFDLYDQTVISVQEEAIRTTLDESLAQMQIDLNNIGEYEERLRNSDGVQVPEQPKAILGDTITADSDGNLSLRTNYVAPTGFDFDWRSGSVAEGYLDAIKAAEGVSNMTTEQFFARKNAEDKNGSGDSKDFETSKIEWLMKDGTPVEDLNTGDSGDTKYTSINNDCQALIQAWSQYWSDKRAYQCTNLKSLLQLEASLELVDTSTTINTSDNVLQLY